MPNAVHEIPALTEKEKERFWSGVDKNGPIVQEHLGPCWLWKRGLMSGGYGCYAVRRRSAGAHRIAFILIRGHIPHGMQVLHACDIRSCVAPHHLFIGTQRDNVLDMCRKGRQAKGDSSGARIHKDRMARGDRHGSVTHPERIVRGERHWKAKLTERNVSDIRSMYNTGYSARVLAIQFGVCISMIRYILNRKCWKHIP